MSWDRPSPTLVTHPAMPATDLGHPEEDRPLSIEEYKRLQEFPDDWELAGSLVEQYRQVGNAVPVSLGYAIGQLIFRLLHNQPLEKPISGFRFSRYSNTRDIEWLVNFQKLSAGQYVVYIFNTSCNLYGIIYLNYMRC